MQLIDPEAPSFDHVMRRIAYKHVSLDIRPEQFTIVGEHLLAAVGEVLGDAITPEVTAAWSEVYWLFALQLVAEEARMYEQANVYPSQPTRAYRVVRRMEETAGVISLVLERADGGPLPAIAPGQYVSVFVDLPDGDRQPRHYTVSSTAVRTRLQITVRRVRGVNGGSGRPGSTRQVDAARPWRTAGPNPLRGLRARPVGRPDRARFGNLKAVEGACAFRPGTRSAEVGWPPPGRFCGSNLGQPCRLHPTSREQNLDLGSVDL
jgi:hypothetical protein